MFAIWNKLQQALFGNIETTPKNPPRGRSKCGGPRPGLSLSMTVRAEYTEYGCTIYGWPSKGGVIVRSNCDIVELRYLGLEPLEASTTSRNEDQDAEDEFCDQLIKIGGRWWGSRRRFLHDVRDVYVRGEEDASDEELGLVWIGWPKDGGLLVLEDIGDALRDPTVGILRLATTMEKRCQLLRERFDAVFFEYWRGYLGFI